MTAEDAGLHESLRQARESIRAGDHIWLAVADAPPRTVRGPLAGVAFGAKDNFFSAAHATSAGTPGLRGWRPRQDAACIVRLVQAGATLIGKTNMHELGFGVTSENAFFGSVRNPSMPGHVAGGSSGGSAAAVAAGHVPFALATDTGGSARIPAAFCGVVGFRPSTGRWPRAGIVPLSPLRDTPGVLAANLEWVARVDEVLSGEAARPACPLPGLTLGVPCGFYREPLAADVAAGFDALLAELREAGVKLVELEIADLGVLDGRIGFTVALYEAARALPAFCSEAGIGFEALVEQVASPDVAAIMRELVCGAVSHEAYRDAVEVALPQLQAAFAQAFAEHRLDAIAVPTCPVSAPLANRASTVELAGRAEPLFPTVSRNTSPASLAGMPSISIPLPRRGGAPGALMLEALRGNDRRLIAIARALAAFVQPAGAVNRL